MSGTRTSEKAFRTQSKGRVSPLKRVLKELGARAIDKRTTLGKVLTQFRADLIQDLGGPTAVSTQEAAFIDLIVKTKYILDVIDLWLLAQPSLINGRKRALHPAVLQRQQLADSLARNLCQLGLRRRAKVLDVAQALRQTRPGDGRASS